MGAYIHGVLILCGCPLPQYYGTTKVVSADDMHATYSTHTSNATGYTTYLQVITQTIKWYLWQSRVEIKHYYVVYFDCVTTFKAL